MGDTDNVVHVDFRKGRVQREPRLLDFGDDKEFLKGLEVGQIWAHLRYYGESGHSGLMAAKMLGQELLCHVENLEVLKQIAEVKGLALLVVPATGSEKFIIALYSTKPQNTPPPKLG